MFFPWLYSPCLTARTMFNWEIAANRKIFWCSKVAAPELRRARLTDVRNAMFVTFKCDVPRGVSGRKLLGQEGRLHQAEGTRVERYGLSNYCIILHFSRDRRPIGLSATHVIMGFFRPHEIFQRYWCCSFKIKRWKLTDHFLLINANNLTHEGDKRLSISPPQSG